jgi:preprotein translocase subunit YajC
MATSPGANQNPLPNILMIISIVAVFYFFMIRPQAKKVKDQKNFIDKLQKGDRVITTTGIHGKIVEVDPAYFMLEVDHNVRMKMEKSAISMELSEALNKPKTITTDTTKV